MRVEMAKPPIVITCDCGESKAIPYGERWVCERCGRSWNTAQIPVEEFEGLLRQVRRRKLEALGAGALFAGILVPLVVLGGARFILLIPLGMAGWLFVFLPFWRRRVRSVARDAPKWQLRPE